jgi:catechol 2,3-dioxygenase-like lactoylglutathione lyase family enzyme
MSEPAVQLSWGHININVRNLERSVAFYQTLGFDVFLAGIPYLSLTTDAEPRQMPDAGARALGLPEGSRARACIMQLRDGFPKIDLTELTGASPRPPLGNADLGLVRFCLASRDLQDDYARLRRAGVEFVSPPQPASDGLADMATCVDPDGTLIELLQVYPERWAALLGR